MNSYEAFASVKEEIPKILESAKLRNGDSLSLSDVKKVGKGKILFWADRNDQDSEADVFVVWKIYGIAPIGAADNRMAVSRETLIYIDIHTKKKETDPVIDALVKRLDGAFDRNGYSFELVSQPERDYQTGRTSLTFEATRKTK